MNKKYSCLILPLALSLLMLACGSSPEQIATMTAAAWTATPKPTNTSVPTLVPTPTPTFTPIPTSTPVPYDLTVSIVDEAGAPVAGAGIIFPESGSDEAVAADAAGKFSWTNLAGPAVTLGVSAQGYLPAAQSATLERGLSEISVVLERDPYGLLPSTACAAGESLLYLEDFQDGQTGLAHDADGPAPAPLGPAVDEAGNTVLIHDFTTPFGDYSSYLTADGAGGFHEFGDAAWRFRFMMTQETNWGLTWNSARATEFGGIVTGQTGYSILFNTSRHLIVFRSIWDTNFQPVFNIGKPDLADEVLILEPGIWHYLEISTYQGQLQVWLDGVSIVDVIDDMPLPPGGFSIGKGDAGILYYDAISVCGLGAPFTSLPAPLPVATP